MTHAPKARTRRPLRFALDGNRLDIYVMEPNVRTNALGLAHRMMHSPDIDYVRRSTHRSGQMVTLADPNGNEIDFLVTETLAQDIAEGAFTSETVPAFEVWGQTHYEWWRQ